MLSLVGDGIFPDLLDVRLLMGRRVGCGVHCFGCRLGRVLCGVGCGGHENGHFIRMSNEDGDVFHAVRYAVASLSMEMFSGQGKKQTLPRHVKQAAVKTRSDERDKGGDS